MFKLDKNNKLIIDPDMLAIPELNTIWENDKTKTKEKATKELQFVYYIADFKSPYRKSYREDDLYNIVKKDFLKDENAKVPERVEKAIEKYKSLQETKVLKFLYKAENVLGQIEDYFDNFDINKIDPDNKSKAITDIMKNLQEVEDVSTKINNAIKRAEAEVKDVKTKQRQISKRELPPNER